jgi:hypothetical protein
MDKRTYIFTKFDSITNTKGIRVALNSNDILLFILSHMYSAVKFRQNVRKKSNFVETNIIVLDIDSAQDKNRSIKDISNELKNLNHIIAPTKSHQTDKGGIVCDRYRILLFTERNIDNVKKYELMLKTIADKYSLNYDKVAKDAGRLFFKSNCIESYRFDGEYVDSGLIIKKVINEKRKFNYLRSKSKLDKQFIEWVQKTQSKKQQSKREDFIRILLAQRNLLRKNVLPQVFIASQVGITRETVKVWLKEFIELGYLKFRDDILWGKGQRAKSYRAFGLLKSSIEKEPISKIELPSVIENGEWNDVLFECAIKFTKQSSDKLFIEWVKTIPNWDSKPERLIQAKNAWKNRKKFINKDK